ncbi:cupin domain-containing protein [Ornithinimicrobium sediminis]|uniref:LuxR family transcriptional regulator n=1 Tax=Ornithinimicrobium sediminis TaxID=2904603 RepID=UPI001E611C42|nr:LuxR family transcriptional regulator [Ornithinimicrobium sediminis]MCE0487049.1 LuxR family transcriptional regulator [Ornithinimicrobium sediminis]
MRTTAATPVTVSSGHGARSTQVGPEPALRQTVVALAEGQGTAGHGEARLYVIQGRVRLRTDGQGWSGSTGDLLVVPPSLAARDDSAVRLTVATMDTPRRRGVPRSTPSKVTRR